MKRFLSFVFILATTLLIPITAHAEGYTLDETHTAVTFKIRHLLSNVQGLFREFEGNFTFDPKDPSTWAVDATINAASIDTNVEARDKHLRSVDFFDVEKFPSITFKSTGVDDPTAEVAKLKGILTMHGISKEIVLDLEIHGVAEDPWGNVRAGFTATTTINRKDFGLVWNETLETGQLLVGEDVKITIEIEGKQKK